MLRRNITRAIDDGIRDAKSRLHNITMAPPYQKGARIVKAAKPSEEGGEARAGICHHNKACYAVLKKDDGVATGSAVPRARAAIGRT